MIVYANFRCFNLGDYIDILITVRVKRLYKNYGYLFIESVSADLEISLIPSHQK